MERIPIDEEDDALRQDTSLNWEELERAASGQLSLFPTVPTVAERVLVPLARDWRAGFEALPDEDQAGKDLDQMALACLLISHDWGHLMTEVARRECELNSSSRPDREYGWIERDGSGANQTS